MPDYFIGKLGEVPDLERRKPGKRQLYDFGSLTVGGPCLIFDKEYARDKAQSIRACACNYARLHRQKNPGSEMRFTVQWIAGRQLAVQRVA